MYIFSDDGITPDRCRVLIVTNNITERPQNQICHSLKCKRSSLFVQNKFSLLNGRFPWDISFFALFFLKISSPGTTKSHASTYAETLIG